tara:strand:- start:2401 stop:2556 length:156 start_codon:yes stop_codon:yes gene_type:complete
LVGFGQIAVVSVDAEQAIDGADFGECRIDGRLCLIRFSVYCDGNKRTQKRL